MGASSRPSCHESRRFVAATEPTSTPRGGIGRIANGLRTPGPPQPHRILGAPGGPRPRPSPRPVPRGVPGRIRDSNSSHQRGGRRRRRGAARSAATRRTRRRARRGQKVRPRRGCRRPPPSSTILTTGPAFAPTWAPLSPPPCGRPFTRTRRRTLGTDANAICSGFGGRFNAGVAAAVTGVYTLAGPTGVCPVSVSGFQRFACSWGLLPLACARLKLVEVEVVDITNGAWRANTELVIGWSLFCTVIA